MNRTDPLSPSACLSAAATTAAAKTAAASERAQRRAAWRWGSLVVGLLGLQLAIGAVAVVLATGDASVAVVPNYHQKAIHWDNQMALQRQSDLLGWQATLDVDQQPAATGHRQLRVRLTDVVGRPLEGATGEVQLYHHARANQIQRVALRPGEAGQYVATAVMPQAGLWEAELNLRDADGARFHQSTTIAVGEDPVAAAQPEDGRAGGGRAAAGQGRSRS